MLGSSLTIENNRKLAIINVQLTFLDEKCEVRLYGLIDDVMGRLMKKLTLDVLNLL